MGIKRELSSLFRSEGDFLVPRELFYRMAALALAAILLSGFLSIQAFAVEDNSPDDETVTPGEREEPVETDVEKPPEGESREDESSGSGGEESEVPPEGAPEESGEESDTPSEVIPNDAVSGDSDNTPDGPQELPGDDDAGDGEFPDDDPGGPSENISSDLEADIHAIRQSIELVLYIIFPLSLAAFLFWVFCKWFYRTFIELVL